MGVARSTGKSETAGVPPGVSLDTSELFVAKASAASTLMSAQQLVSQWMARDHLQPQLPLLVPLQLPLRPQLQLQQAMPTMVHHLAHRMRLLISSLISLVP